MSRGDFTAEPVKLVLHAIQGAFTTQLRFPSHDVVGPDTRTRVHLIDYGRPSVALEHGPDARVETNWAHAIQVEIAMFAEDAANKTDAWYNGLAATLLPAIIEKKIPLEVDDHEWNGHDRFADQEWLHFTGITAHAVVPYQPSGHWDPGPLDKNRLLAALRKALGGTSTTPTSPTLEVDPMARMVGWASDDGKKAGTLTLNADGTALVCGQDCNAFKRDGHKVPLDGPLRYAFNAPVAEIVKAHSKAVWCRRTDGSFEKLYLEAGQIA